MSDPKPTVSTVSPIGWEPKAGDKVERLNAPLLWADTYRPARPVKAGRRR